MKNAEFQPNPEDAVVTPAAYQGNMNAAAAGATAPRRSRFDRALLLAVLAMQCVVLAAIGIFFYSNSNGRRQHEPLGTHPTTTTPPNRGDVVLPSDASSVPAARAPTLQAVTPSRRARVSQDPFARMQAEANRLMLGLAPNPGDSFATIHGFPRSANELDAHMNRMMENAMQEFRALEASMHFDEGWTALGRSPTLDMQDAGRDYVVVCSLPGLDDTDVRVTLEGRLLTIVGQSSSTARHPLETVQFERRVWLPGPVDEGDKASAMLTNGVLRVMVPKADSMPQVAKLTRLM